MKLLPIIIIVFMTIAFFSYKTKKEATNLLTKLQKEISLDVIINSRPIVTLNNEQEMLFIINYDNISRLSFHEIDKITLIAPRKNGNNAGGTIGKGSGVIGFADRTKKDLLFNDIGEDIDIIKLKLIDTNLSKKVFVNER